MEASLESATPFACSRHHCSRSANFFSFETRCFRTASNSFGTLAFLQLPREHGSAIVLLHRGSQKIRSQNCFESGPANDLTYFLQHNFYGSTRLPSCGSSGYVTMHPDALSTVDTNLAKRSCTKRDYVRSKLQNVPVSKSSVPPPIDLPRTYR